MVGEQNGHAGQRPLPFGGNQWVAQLAAARKHAEDTTHRLAEETARADGLLVQLTANRIQVGELESVVQALAAERDCGADAEPV